MGRMIETVDWRAFLARLDMIWDPLVHRGGRYYDHSAAATRCDWGEAALLGNGMLGAAVYKKAETGLTWELGRSDVEAHNHLQGVDWSVPRIPIGDLVLFASEAVQRETMRLELYDAQASGCMRTASGQIHWRSFVHAEADILVLETTAESAEAHLALEPAHGVSPRLAWVPPERQQAASPLPPKPTVEQLGEETVAVQELVNDQGEISGEFAIALKQQKLEPGRQVFFVSVTHSRTQLARKEAMANVRRAAAKGLEVLRSEHQQWWHNYYRRSFVSLSDTRWEAFYWIQMYKLASAVRGHMDEVIDNQGPWLTDTSWPGSWWNLNVQLSYSPLYKANRLELGESLLNTIEAHQEHIRQNAAPVVDDGMYIGRATGRMCDRNRLPSYERIMEGKVSLFELGNFTWSVKHLYTHYQSTMDQQLLQQRVFPILRANLNIALKLLHPWSDGKLHLPKTTSPEYPDPKGRHSNSCPVHDASYDLALIRWGLETLVDICDRYGWEDELYETWKQALADLTPLCTDDNGIMVGRDLPFARSHRHYSHLFALYPLHQLDLQDEEERDLAQRSLLHWINMKGALTGYSYTGAAIMAAILGDGELALNCLNGLREYLLPNTMYIERGGPVIETPLSGAESIHYMLMHNYQGVIRVFPGVPPSWDVAFSDLLAEGAFLVSGQRREGVNQWVYVESLAGEPLRIQPNLSGPVQIESSQVQTLTEVAPGTYAVDLKQGEGVLLYTGERPIAQCVPVETEPQWQNHYGSLKAGMGSMAKFPATGVMDNPRQ